MSWLPAQSSHPLYVRSPGEHILDVTRGHRIFPLPRLTLMCGHCVTRPSLTTCPAFWSDIASHHGHFCGVSVTGTEITWGAAFFAAGTFFATAT